VVEKIKVSPTRPKKSARNEDRVIIVPGVYVKSKSSKNLKRNFGRQILKLGEEKVVKTLVAVRKTFFREAGGVGTYQKRRTV